MLCGDQRLVCGPVVVDESQGANKNLGTDETSQFAWEGFRVFG